MPELRRAEAADIAAMHRIRCAVTENRLSDPARLTERDYRPYLAARGETWCAIIDNRIAGFGSLDLLDHSIWALFVDPICEGRGLGKLLLNKLVERADLADIDMLKLVTTPGTRAEAFYLRCGWQTAGTNDHGECILTIKPRDRVAVTG